MANFNMPWVHLLDVVEAHIAAAERDEASGRYMLVSSWGPLTESASIIKGLNLPGLSVATEIAEGLVPAPLGKFDCSRAENELLGRPLRGLRECMMDAVETLRSWGHLPRA